MGIAQALDRMPGASTTPAERFRAALALYEQGIALQRQNLRRRCPTLTPAELDVLIDAWPAREPAR
jgi:hypothetical protein